MVVLKYGGMLLRDAGSRTLVARDVEAARAAGRPAVVVVSAMGGAGDPYATDTLLGLLEAAGGRPDARTQDLLLSCGEVVSATLMAHLLAARGSPVRALTGPEAGVRTSDRFGAAAVLRVEVARLREELAGGVVPVVAGFQGAAPAGEVATLGRGGSDLTAVALGAALGAAVEIVKEVPGVMSGDPARVPAARLLPRVEHATVRRLALHGSPVLHARAAALAERAAVPLLVRQVLSRGGTVIMSTGAIPIDDVPDGAVVAVTDRRGLSVLRVEMRREKAGALLAELRDGTPGLDSMWMGETSLVALAPAVELAPLAGRLGRQGLSPVVRAGCARVTAVGAHLPSAPTCLLHGLDALAARGIPVFEVRGDTETISYVLPEAQADEALRALHDAFDLARDPVEVGASAGG